MAEPVTMIICTRGRANSPRCACGNKASLLCDYALTGPKAGQTCSKPLCRRCAVVAGKDKHYCVPHWNMRRKDNEGKLSRS